MSSFHSVYHADWSESLSDYQFVESTWADYQYYLQPQLWETWHAGRDFTLLKSKLRTIMEGAIEDAWNAMSLDHGQLLGEGHLVTLYFIIIIIAYHS